MERRRFGASESSLIPHSSSLLPKWRCARLHVIPELVDVAGQVKVRLTIRKGGPDGPVLDADLVNPYRAAERRRAAVRLADRVGEPHAADRIERAILQCVEMITDARSPAGGDDATGSPDERASRAN